MISSPGRDLPGPTSLCLAGIPHFLLKLFALQQQLLLQPSAEIYRSHPVRKAGEGGIVGCSVATGGGETVGNRGSGVVSSMPDGLARTSGRLATGSPTLLNRTWWIDESLFSTFRRFVHQRYLSQD